MQPATHSSTKQRQTTANTYQVLIVPAGSAAMSEALYLYTSGSTLSNGACFNHT